MKNGHSCGIRRISLAPLQACVRRTPAAEPGSARVELPSSARTALPCLSLNNPAAFRCRRCGAVPREGLFPARSREIHLYQLGPSGAPTEQPLRGSESLLKASVIRSRHEGEKRKIRCASWKASKGKACAPHFCEGHRKAWP